MYHSTMVLLEGGETVYVQGRLAVSPFSTSTFGVTFTVTAPLHTAEKHDKAEIENITRRHGGTKQQEGSAAHASLKDAEKK